MNRTSEVSKVSDFPIKRTNGFSRVAQSGARGHRLGASCQGIDIRYGALSSTKVFTSTRSSVTIPRSGKR
jgi:hypothetical protein